MDHISASSGSNVSRITRFAAMLPIAALSWIVASHLPTALGVPRLDWDLTLAALPYLLVARLAGFWHCRLDRVYPAHVGMRDLHMLLRSAVLGSGLFLVLLTAGGVPLARPLSVLMVLELALVIAGIAGVWMAARWHHERSELDGATRAKRAFIIGAGDAGEHLLRQLQHDGRHAVEVVGLIDDDPAMADRALHGVPVVGGVDDLRRLAAMHRATLALVAIPTVTPEQLRRIVRSCREADVTVRLLPPLRALITTDIQPTALREVRLEDLLGRPPVELDLSAVRRDVEGKAVLVTGAAGSIGSELVRQLASFRPSKLILLDRAESPLHTLHAELLAAGLETTAVPVLASVTNQARLERVFQTHAPAFVFHAAAYKQLPLLEWNVVEGLWNNVIGTARVARCAARAGVERFVLISTDKAVRPSSVLGVTKLLAERVVLELPTLRASSTDFRVVRFGNVLGSEGSVVPHFARQIAAGGPVTVTHPDVRRYFMTIPEAAQLVLEASSLPEAAGRIAILEMGEQVRILELAEQMIQLAGRVPHDEVAITFTGLRTGEKLEEELVGPGEATAETSAAKIRLIERAASTRGDLARRLRQLVALATRGDEASLLRALAALAPEYRPELGPPSHAVSYDLRLHEREGVGAVHAGNGNGNGNGHRNGNGNGNGHAVKARRGRLPAPRAPQQQLTVFSATGASARSGA